MPCGSPATLPPAPGVLTRDALAAARWQLAADYVVQGSYLSLPGPEGEVLRLDVVLQNTASGETVGTVSGTGAANRLFSLVDDAAAQLRAKLGLEPPAPQAAAAAAAAAFPARPEAARLYAEGLEKLRQYDALGARPLLERAIAIEERVPARPRGAEPGARRPRLRSAGRRRGEAGRWRCRAP